MILSRLGDSKSEFLIPILFLASVFLIPTVLVGGLIEGVAGAVIIGFLFGFAVLMATESLRPPILTIISVSLFGGLSAILINFKEALPFINGTLPVLGLILGLIILTEILFWIAPKEKVKKKNLFNHTLLRKGEAFLESLMIFSAITQIYVFTREIDFVKYFPEILK